MGLRKRAHQPLWRVGTKCWADERDIKFIPGSGPHVGGEGYARKAKIAISNDNRRWIRWLDKPLLAVRRDQIGMESGLASVGPA